MNISMILRKHDLKMKPAYDFRNRLFSDGL